ncbi:non-hydrolyzing UDP-N-acetylglucosamine 2-epimerase [Sphingomonas morindae]|uniref:UDP-N-acetylglucosamine 2-epimerase (non-hydrolyzing) n=1 Tax=Sphingomonas morindae TaxID=1541170 RepID=A0ABY4X7Z5_9SPHN|nr:UDP-N-acetylglucosamine 2-epimerase (non-hydrolyzing) [Sphingomonas morindae]USI72960.1 UDP-N-acetylglucosamine 2-epimerase (non-hydrolyzing) [Sphingomonas morindae]
MAGERDIAIVIGTRPEAIKTAPLLLAGGHHPRLRLRLISTGQQPDYCRDALAEFGLVASHLLPAPRPGAALDMLVGHHARAIMRLLRRAPPALMLVQGDTSSALAGALAARALGVPLGHVEAGLRSGDLTAPWPEERNRRVIDALADLLFAPSVRAAARLAAEGHDRTRIHRTGNTGIDALLWMRARRGAVLHAPARRLILFTCHRRESFGAPLAAICAAVLRLAARGDVEILCPVHANPAAAAPIRALLGGRATIRLVAALPYSAMVDALAGAYLILTDSGGIQEEAAALGTPTLVLRRRTERPEVLAGGVALVGTDTDAIVAAAERLLDDPAHHRAMQKPAWPFGKGDAAGKILDHIEQYFSTGRLRDRPLLLGDDWTKDGAPKGA